MRLEVEEAWNLSQSLCHVFQKHGDGLQISGAMTLALQDSLHISITSSFYGSVLLLGKTKKKNKKSLITTSQMPAWKVQKEMENKAPKQMAETTVIEVTLFINQEQLNLTLLTEGPQTSPPLPTGLLLHRHFWAAAAEWDGFPFFLLSSFCAWLQVPVALPKPALWFTEVVSSNTKR